MYVECVEHEENAGETRKKEKTKQQERLHRCLIVTVTCTSEDGTEDGTVMN